MLASRKKDVALYRVAAGADLQQVVQVATVMEHAPAAYRDLLKVVRLASRETHQTLRACVRECALAQRTYAGLGRHMAHDTSAPMDIGHIGQVKVVKSERVKKGKGKGENKDKKESGDAKGSAPTDDSHIAGECGYCGKWSTRRPSARKQKTDQGGKPLAATIQAFETGQIQSGESDLIVGVCCERLEWTDRENSS